MTSAATGHRPDRLGGYDLKTRRALGALAVEYLHESNPSEMIVGMAQGWDQAVAAACVVLGIPFIAAVPFKEQASKWPAEAQVRWQRLLDHAAHVEIISDHPSAHALDLRNRWMVDRAGEMIALWDGGLTGGTANCIRYAEQQGVPFTNLWSRWVFGQDQFALLLG